jgi:hypothetical protein
MINNKYIFKQDVDTLKYSALGDGAVRIISIYNIIKQYNLDAYIIPTPNKDTIMLWNDCFKERIITNDTIPQSHKDAYMCAPLWLDWHYGLGSFYVFESVFWENGFLYTKDFNIEIPLLYKCNINSNGVMIYPKEGTSGNRVFEQSWYKELVDTIHKNGHKVNLFGDIDFLPGVQVDKHFPRGVENMKKCLDESFLAIGGSTGPTWALLMSDVPQIVLDPRTVDRYWHFCRIKNKKITVYTQEETLLNNLFMS